MDYSSLFCRSPVQNRGSNDRFLSPSRPPMRHRGSVTPDANLQSRSARFSMAGLPIVDSVPCHSPRPSVCRSLFQSQSQEVFSPRRSSVRRSSLRLEDSSPTNSPTRNRNYPTKAYNTLTLPKIPCDFYTSPMEWTKTDHLLMALGDSVVVVNPKTLEKKLLGNLSSDVQPISLKANAEGTQAWLGGETGTITRYDLKADKQMDCWNVFDSGNNVYCVDWMDNKIAVGGRDGEWTILDERGDRLELVARATPDGEEVCCIKFHYNRSSLAIASNDGHIEIYDLRNLDHSVSEFTQHQAAVKALCWCPFDPNLVLTGGGTHDKKLMIWNMTTAEVTKTIPTGSQVCNVYWNETYNEIVSTHGFTQNNIAVWRGSDHSLIRSYHTHTNRVLYMAVSPDGSSVATAAPGDNVQFWKFWPAKSSALSQSLFSLR